MYWRHGLVGLLLSLGLAALLVAIAEGRAQRRQSHE